MQTAGHFTKTEVNSQTCQHIQTVYETSHLFTVQQEVIASWGYLYFRQQRTDKKRKCTYTKHYKPLRGIRFQFVSWLELLYHEFESYCHCSMPQKVLIGSVRVLLIYLHSGSPPSPKLYLDFVLGWWEYPGSKHGETSMLWAKDDMYDSSGTYVTHNRSCWPLIKAKKKVNTVDILERHYNLNANLWTFVNVLRRSLSKQTVNVRSSRTLILALTALNEC